MVVHGTNLSQKNFEKCFVPKKEILYRDNKPKSFLNLFLEFFLDDLAPLY
jgi:hypothetical protein